jgi:hypothetical protein
VSQYLEGYLWPHFDAATASDGHVMSMLLMINEKFREGVPAWGGFHAREVCVLCAVLAAHACARVRDMHDMHDMHDARGSGHAAQGHAAGRARAAPMRALPRRVVVSPARAQDAFPAFFGRVLALRQPERYAKLAQHEQVAHLLFLINAFQSLEDEMVRGQVRAAWCGTLGRTRGGGDISGGGGGVCVCLRGGWVGVRAADGGAAAWTGEGCGGRRDVV